jgi:hypothetical protein
MDASAAAGSSASSGGGSESFRDALRALGVTHDTLDSSEKAQLDREGWLALEGLLDPDAAGALAAENRRLWRAAGSPEGGGVTVTELHDKSGRYDVCVTHPRVLAAVEHVLGGNPFYSAGVHMSSPSWPPADRHQELHHDGEFSAAGHFLCCNSLWLLADFGPHNGPTRLVPRTHLLRESPAAMLEDTEAAHPDEIRTHYPAGTAIVWNARLWHGASANPTGAPRPSVQSFWSRREYPFEGGDEGDRSCDCCDPATAAATARRRNEVSEATWRRLSPAARQLFDLLPRSAAPANRL